MALVMQGISLVILSPDSFFPLSGFIWRSSYLIPWQTPWSGKHVFPLATATSLAASFL